MKKIFSLFAAISTLAIEPCKIEIVEKGSNWPVPLVELRTVNQIRFVSDNNGLIAMDAPDLMGHEVWFDVSSPGYEIPKDGFGMHGFRFVPQPGKSKRIEVTRTIVAKRIGRITGAGLFVESQKLGKELDWLESGIVGQDSVQNAVHNGKMFWIWGDTSMPNYPLGIFDGTGATTAIAPLQKFEPPLKLKLDYFVDDKHRPRAVAPLGGSGPTWITGFVTLPDQQGRERMVASYMKIKPPLEIYRWGLCVWNDASAKFEPFKILWEKSEKSPKPPALIPDGHPAIWSDDAGKKWLLFGNPLPKFKCPASFEASQDTNTWEKLSPPDSLPSASDGAPVKLHSGAIAWNPYRKRWIAIYMQSFGKPSAHGELWYAESLAPTGPWGKTVKILTHENYTFYNPRIHPEFTPADSPVLLFEGTYTRDFADRPFPTARYDYNQVLYRLDLNDPLLKPAQN
jgi:hypothetical protein